MLPFCCLLLPKLLLSHGWLPGPAEKEPQQHLSLITHSIPAPALPPSSPPHIPQVQEEDLQRVAEATGGQIQTTVNNLSPKALGTCAVFEERQVGAERYNLFTGAPSCTQGMGRGWVRGF